MEAIAYIVFGFLIGLIPAWLARRRRLKAHWGALRAETDICKSRATTLVSAGIQAPLYRLPLDAFRHSFPALLADGALTEKEVRILSEFYNQAQDINRGLDNATAMYQIDSLNKLQAEHDRKCKKAQDLVESNDAQSSLYADAIEVIDRRFGQKWHLYAKCT